MAVWIRSLECFKCPEFPECPECFKVPMGRRDLHGALSAQMDVSSQGTEQVLCRLNKISS
jgi:hypothetical protein